MANLNRMGKEKNTGCEKGNAFFFFPVKILLDIRGMVCNESVVDSN